MVAGGCEIEWGLKGTEYRGVRRAEARVGLGTVVSGYPGTVAQIMPAQALTTYLSDSRMVPGAPGGGGWGEEDPWSFLPKEKAEFYMPRPQACGP